MRSIEKQSTTRRRRYIRRWGAFAGIIVVGWGLGAVIPVADTDAQVPGVWGGPGVAPPAAPAPPVALPYPGPYDPRAFYPPPYYYYPPGSVYPCPRVWVPGYYDAYGNWVFGYYQYQCY